MEELIARLRNNDIYISLNGEDLKVNFKGNELSQLTLKELKDNKYELIDYLKKNLSGLKFQKIQSQPKAKYYDLSSAQRRLWILSQFEGGNLAYNLPGIYEFEGDLDIVSFQKSFATLVERHEILRTVFKKDETGEIKQWIKTTEEQGFEVAYQDLRKIKNQKSKVKALIQAETEKVFDLEQSPLLRAQLLQTGKDKYIFTYVMHHIISDMWSMVLLIKELLTLYNSYSQGKENPLEALKIQYKDYSAWQLSQLENENGQHHKNYWLNQFSGELPVLELPTDHIRPALKTYNGGVISGFFSESSSNELKEIIKEESSTVFIGLLSLVKTLLYRYTSQEDIVIGSPIAGREHADLADQIGFYVNTLALRTQFAGEDSFKELLQKVKQITLSAYEHQIYPFDELVEVLNLNRDLSRSPLFDVMVVLQNNERISKDKKLGELEVFSYEASESLISRFDLTFNFIETDQGFYYAINYNTDLFENGTIERLESHLKQLAESIIASPEKSINELNYLGKKEARQLLVDFNDTKIAYLQDKTIVHLFEDQVVKTPNNIALVFDEKEYTYKEINELANQLGDYLRNIYKIKGDDLVGICLVRSEWIIISILGVLKSGAAYVPIDPEYPEDRISFMLSDSNCKALIDEKELEKFKANQDKYTKENLPIHCKSNNLAYIIYTSGSTGKPKGVMIEHRSLINEIASQSETFQIVQNDRILQAGPCFFDVSVEQIFLALCNGAALVLIEDKNLFNADFVEDLINKEDITHLHLTPSLLKNIKPKYYKSLKRVLSDGDTVPLSLAKKWFPFVVFYNKYGPTETTINSTVYKYIEPNNLTSLPIGKPIANTQVYIIDGNERILPIGVVGEICISGAGLARGYLNRLDLTSEKFIPNRFKEGTYIYKTGDLGRWLADGNIEFIGRKDDQIKIRGYRIELGEIENALQQHPAIEQTVVLLKEDGNQEKQLVAYLTSQEELTTSDLRAYLKKRLPNYMLPSHFVLLEAFPLTPNGKIDKKVLPSPEGLGLASGVEYVSPSTQIEKELVKIWSEVLKMEEEKIGVKDGFFDLGGHSLRATTLASKIYQRLEVNVALKVLFENTTIEEQALFILKEGKTTYYQIEKVGEQESYPLSSAQKRLWILSQFEEGNLAYNIPGIYEFEGDLDIVSFQKSFDTLIERHEILRTVFKKDASGEIRQWVKTVEEKLFEIDYQDLRKIKNQKSKVKTLVQLETAKVFDLEQGPLLRAQLLQVEKDKYVFTYIMHHIISDGWSMGVLIKELLTLYNSYCQGKENLLEALDIQYKDYSAWQLSQLEDEKGKLHKDYWLNQFSGDLPVLELPIDHIRPVIKTYNGSIITTLFSKEKIQKLKVITQSEGSTLYMGLLSLVKTLLYRYTGQEDIIVGTPIAGREHADLSNQIGFYINTLVLRNKINGKESFRELLKKIKQTTLDAYDHQVYPFDVLIEDLHLEKDLSRSPLFDIWVVLQNIDFESRENLNLGDLSVSTYETIEYATSQFDLSFIFSESKEGLNLILQYNTDLFERATIERFQTHLDQLLSSIVENPDQSLKAISFLNKSEKQQQLVDFNDTNVNYPKDKTIVHLFEEQVAKTPNNIALAFKEKEFTYQELDRLSNELAHCLLSEYKIQPEEIVGIQLEKSHWFIISILGILKAGGAYLPIDTEYPTSRKEFLLKDSNTQLLITSTNYIFDLDFYDGNIFSIDVEFEANKYPAESVKTKQSNNNLAYVMYTSGSTGQPKGVQIEHQSIVRLVFKPNYITFKETDVLLSTGSPSFDASTFEYWGMLLNGGTLILSEAALFTDANLLLKEIEKKSVNMMWFTSGLLNQLVDTDITVFSRLETIIAGGDKLSLSHIQKLKETYPKTNIINGYGPTENTTFSLTYKIPSKEIIQIPIGKPITNTDVYVLDVNLNMLPLGAVGEICLSGSGLARGYLNRPKLTAEKFVSNPFKEGGRLYKTGDLGRWLIDGNIEFIGRKDDQVKIRGYRIELGEIESVLQKKEKIDQVVVLVKEDENAEKQLVAYLTSAEELTTLDLRTYLKKTLPDYMLPSYFVRLSNLPLTPNGKVDKKALPSPEGLGLNSGIEYVSPSTEIEKELVAIWSEVLKIDADKIGVKDDFFDLGGHSLRATTLASKIYQRLEVTVSLKNLFENTTIEEQSLFISKEEKTSYYQIAKVAAQESYALSSAQRRLWILSQFEGGNLAYNIPGVYEFKGDLDIPAFQKSFDTLIERHEILRTVFKQDASGEIRQWVKAVEEQGFEIDYQDLRKIKNKKTKVKALVQIEIEKSFDLDQGPLMRAQLLQISKKNYIFTYVMHHIISDGWSMGVMIKELLTLYNSYSQGKPSPLEELSIQYKDYSAWQLNQLEDEHGQGHKDYWLNQFSGELPILELPIDHIRPALKTYNGSNVLGVFSEHISSQLQQLIKTENSTLFMGLLSLVKSLLYRYTGQEDIIIGSPIAGREHADLADQIGFYVNTLALRTQFGGDDNFSELLQKVKATTLSAYEHQIYPFDELVDHLNLKKDLSRSPLFDVLVVLQNNEITSKEEKLGELQISSFEASNSLNSKFDLSFNFIETDQGLNYSITYNTDLFEKETIKRLKNHLNQLLASIVASPEKSINQLGYLSKSEEQQLLLGFNDTNADYPKDKTIIELFEDQVSKTPNNIAVVFEDKEITYQELNERANRFGAYLKEVYDIQSDDLVAINLDRSEWMIISILGVLKSGGAYVPIDPEYPEERISFMLKDSTPKLVIDEKELDKFKKAKESYAKENLPILTKSKDLAYVIYTSGSTGKPKGVMIENSSVVNLITNQILEFNINESENILQFSNISFDASVEQIFIALLTGASLTVIKDEYTKDLSLLKKIIINKKITHFHTTPSLLRQFDESNIETSDIKRIISGGDLCSDLLINQYKGNYDFYNEYGPTESTVTCIQLLINKSIGNKISIIGKPINNTEIYILGKKAELLPEGISGEIYIGGSGLARGYLNRPELTAEKFLSNPFKEEERMYKTGDLGRWLPDGNIEFMGRKDDQVKIRGYRIELGEIESSLLENTTIEQAIVQVKETTNHDKQLIAYLISKEELTTSDLRSFLKKRLPDYMLPSHFVLLEELPLTPNGKIDKKALPSPEGLGLATGVEYIAPSTEVEKELVRIWSEVLNVEEEKIGIKDDFFDLGGHSLNAVNLMTNIKKKLSKDISIQNIFANSTVESLANLLLNYNNNNNLELVDCVNLEKENKQSFILFPYAGALLGSYAALAKELSSLGNVYTVSFPWHHWNIESEIESLNELKPLLLQEIISKVPQNDLYLLGSSAGTSSAMLIAYELSRLNYKVKKIFQCAQSFRKEVKRQMLEEVFGKIDSNHLLGYEEFIEIDDVDDAFKQKFIEGINKDTKLSFDILNQIYNNEKLNIPIHCILGEEDRATKNHVLSADSWKHFSDEVDYSVISQAGHYFVNNNIKETVKIIKNNM